MSRSASRTCATWAPTLARSNGHHRDWLDAIKGGKNILIISDRAVGPDKIAVPALLALFLYALLPIMRTTVTGLAEVSDGLRAAGQAHTEASCQRLRRVVARAAPRLAPPRGWRRPVAKMRWLHRAKKSWTLT